MKQSYLEYKSKKEKLVKLKIKEAKRKAWEEFYMFMELSKRNTTISHLNAHKIC